MMVFFVAGHTNSISPGFINKGEYDAVTIKYDQYCENNENVFNSIYDVKNIESNISTIEELEKLRGLVNIIKSEELKNYLNKKIDNIYVEFGESGQLDLKKISANFDAYIEPKNALIMSIETLSVTFEDFSGVEDMEKTNAINISINSSLPYSLNAYLPTEIQGDDKSNIMNKAILNIKESSENVYQTFANTTDKIILKDNYNSGNGLIHEIDIKLKGGITYKEDIYKTTIKFEVEQK